VAFAAQRGQTPKGECRSQRYSYLKLIKYEIPNQVGNDITDKFQGDSGSQAGMTEGLRVNFKDIERDTFCLQHLYVKISMEV